VSVGAWQPRLEVAAAGHRRFRMVTSAEGKLDAAAHATHWGYPRFLAVDEILKAAWFWYGYDALVWYTGSEVAELHLHACARPDARGRLAGKREMLGVEVIAELLGAERLVVDGEDPKLHRLLRAHGWQKTETGSVVHLGG